MGPGCFSVGLKAAPALFSAGGLTAVHFEGGGQRPFVFTSFVFLSISVTHLHPQLSTDLPRMGPLCPWGTAEAGQRQLSPTQHLPTPFPHKAFLGVWLSLGLAQQSNRAFVFL
jgi:hypothetical protein